jgi:hypothetical protein
MQARMTDSTGRFHARKGALDAGVLDSNVGQERGFDSRNSGAELASELEGEFRVGAALHSGGGFVSGEIHRFFVVVLRQILAYQAEQRVPARVVTAFEFRADGGEEVVRKENDFVLAEGVEQVTVRVRRNQGDCQIVGRV